MFYTTKQYCTSTFNLCLTSTLVWNSFRDNIQCQFNKPEKKENKNLNSIFFLSFFFLLTLVNPSSHWQNDFVHGISSQNRESLTIWIARSPDEWVPWTQLSTVSLTAPLLKHHITQHPSIGVVTGINKHDVNKLLV